MQIAGILSLVESVDARQRLLILALSQRWLLIMLLVLPADEQATGVFLELFEADNHLYALLHVLPGTTRVRREAGQASTAWIIRMQVQIQR